MMKKVAAWLVMMLFLTSSVVVSAKSIELSDKERTFLALRMSWKTLEPDDTGLFAHHMVNMEKNENFPEMSILTLISEYYDEEGVYMGTKEFFGQIPAGSIDFNSRIGTYLQLSMYVEGLETFYPQQRGDTTVEDIDDAPAESGAMVHTFNFDVRLVPGNPERGIVDNGTSEGIFGSYHNRKNHSVEITGSLDGVALGTQAGTLVLTNVPHSPPGVIEYIRRMFH